MMRFIITIFAIFCPAFAFAGCPALPFEFAAQNMARDENIGFFNGDLYFDKRRNDESQIKILNRYEDGRVMVDERPTVMPVYGALITQQNGEIAIKTITEIHSVEQNYFGEAYSSDTVPASAQQHNNFKGMQQKAIYQVRINGDKATLDRNMCGYIVWRQQDRVKMEKFFENFTAEYEKLNPTTP